MGIMEKKMETIIVLCLQLAFAWAQFAVLQALGLGVSGSLDFRSRFEISGFKGAA